MLNVRFWPVPAIATDPRVSDERPRWFTRTFQVRWRTTCSTPARRGATRARLVVAWVRYARRAVSSVNIGKTASAHCHRRLWLVATRRSAPSAKPEFFGTARPGAPEPIPPSSENERPQLSCGCRTLPCCTNGGDATWSGHGRVRRNHEPRIGARARTWRL